MREALVEAKSIREPAPAALRLTDRQLQGVILAAVFLLSLLLFTYTWWLSLDRPRGAYTGYFGWYDQSQYLAIARYLAAGHLPPRQGYTYGLGYPLLAAPFIKLGFPREPFLAPNALAFAATLTMVARLGARLRSLTFGVVCAAALAVASPLLPLTVVPWSSTVTLVAVTAVLLVVTAPRPGILGAMVVGLAVGACFATRYIDAAFPLLIGYAGLASSRAGRVRMLGIASLAAAAIIVPVLLSHWLILGNALTTPYASHLEPGNVGISDQNLGSFNFLRVPARAVGAFITALQGGQRVPGQPLGALFPWAIAAPLGMAVLLLERHPHRRAMAIAFTVSIAGTIFYLAFRASGPGGLQFGFLHYFKVWFVLWGILAAYGFARLADRLDQRLRGAR